MAYATNASGKRPSEMSPDDPNTAIAIRSKGARVERLRHARFGPMEKIYLFWLVGASCDGCTIAVTGATNPKVEHLLQGIVPGLPRVDLIHTVASVEVGPDWSEGRLSAASQDGVRRKAAANARGMQGYAAGR